MSAAKPQSFTFATLKQTLRRLGPAAPMAIAVTTLPPIGSLILVTVASTTSLAQWMQDHSSTALPIYVVAFWVLGLFTLPTYAYSVLGGYAFGFWPGLVAATLAYAGACAGAFAIARSIAAERVKPMLDEHPYLGAVRHTVADAPLIRATFLIALLRISPASPFAITNVVLGAGGVRWVPYLAGSALGVVPRTAAVVWVASRLDSLSFKSAEGWWLFAVGIVATILVIAIIARLARNELDRHLSAKDRAVQIVAPVTPP
jgi:uncharacterized membrane protein YdjX (TVP38/TMEM64 family)